MLGEYLDLRSVRRLEKIVELKSFVLLSNVVKVIRSRRTKETEGSRVGWYGMVWSYLAQDRDH